MKSQLHQNLFEDDSNLLMQGFETENFYWSYDIGSPIESA